MSSKLQIYTILIGFLWIPVLIAGNEIIYISELIIAISFIFNFMVFRKIKIQLKDLIIAIPFFIFLYRIIFAFYSNESIVAKEYFLAAKQLEYFVIYLTFINILRHNPKELPKIKTVIKWLFVSYTLYILADGILILDDSIRATIPFKPGGSSSLSGMFTSITGYIFMIETINSKTIKTALLNFTIFLVSMGALMLTFSRTAIFIFIMNILIFFIIYFIYSKNKINVGKIIAVGIIMLTFANVVLMISDYNYGGLTDLSPATIINTLQNNNSFNIRMEVLIKQRFIDNYGADNSTTFWRMLFGNPDASYEVWDNQYMMILNNYGAIGIIGFFIYLFYIFKNILKKMSSNFNRLMFLVMTHVIIAGITLESLTNIYVFLHILMILIAILFFSNEKVIEG